MKKTNIALTSLVGVPISAFAIYLACICLNNAFQRSPTWESVGVGFIGIGFAWAAITGVRNLCRFQKAHLHLRWHDWVGGILGGAANILLTGCLITAAVDLVEQPHHAPLFSPWFAAGVALGLSSVGSIICFFTVLIRFVRSRKMNHQT